MSETESLILKQRIHEDKRTKTRRGELGMRVSMGYIRQLSGGVVKDPDEQLQSVIERVFELFERKRILLTLFGISSMTTTDASRHVQIPKNGRIGHPPWEWD